MDKIYITRKLRNELDGKQLYENYKNAINTYKKSLENEEYIVSFLISTALYEERVNVCYVLLKWYENIIIGSIDFRKEKSYLILKDRVGKENTKEAIKKVGIPTLNDVIFPSFDEKYKPTEEEMMELTIKDKLLFVKEKGYCNNKYFNKSLSLSRARNTLVHMSFHNLENYSHELCEDIFGLFTYFNNCSKKIKKDLRFGKK